LEEESSPEKVSPKKNVHIKPDEDLPSALKRAIHMSDKALLREVLDRDKSLATHQIDASKKIQVIHKACATNDVSIVELLLNHGADIDAQDSKKWTPLMIAAMNGHYDLVSFLTR
jgi:ankyrin repeat protein